MILKTYRLKDYNFMLIIFTILLSVIGVFAISSAMGEAGFDNVRKQIGGIIVGTKTTYVPGLHMKEAAIGAYRNVVRKELDKRVREAFK